MNTVGNLTEQTEDLNDAPLKFERRRAERWPMDGAASAFRLTGDSFGLMHDLVVNDYSQGGVGVISESPIEPGTLISIGFQQPGVVARRGVVRRCQPCGKGYRVGVQFELRQAA